MDNDNCISSDFCKFDVSRASGDALENNYQKQVASKNIESWPEPIPFQEELLPVPEFDPLLLPPELRRYAEDVAETIQCPIDYIAIGLLTVFSSIIGAGCAIRPFREGDWTVVVNLWGAIVGPPSVKKTPALNAATAPLAALENEADKAFSEDKLKFEVDKVEQEARRKIIKNDIESAVKNECEPEIEAKKAALLSLEKKSNTPRCKRYKTNDSTVAKLTELLAENPRGILVFRDEIIGFLTTLEQEGREDARAFYLEAWNGWSSSSGKTDRIARGTTSFNACASVLGGIQPSKLRLYLQETLESLGNDGFIQRFQLLVYPNRPNKWTLIDRKSDIAARNQVISIGKELAKTDFLSLGAKCEGDFPLPVFRFAPDAQRFFNDWLTKLEGRFISELDEGLITEHLAKYRSLMPSLALISFLVRAAGRVYSREDFLDFHAGVDLEDARRAADLCDFLEKHARRVYGMIDRRGIHAAKTLFNKIRQGGLMDGFTLRDIHRKNWSGLSKPKHAEEACDELVEMGWLRKESSPTTSKGGAPTVRYRSHPKLHKMERDETDNTDS